MPRRKTAKSSPLDSKKLRKLQDAVALRAIQEGDSAVAKELGYARSTVQYWRLRLTELLEDPTIERKHGGARAGLYKFDEAQRDQYERDLFEFVLEFPQSSLSEMRAYLARLNYDDLKISMVQATLAKWRWTKRSADTKQIIKYTPENVRKYLEFCVLIASLDPRLLKFLDESSFDSRTLCRWKTWAPINSPTTPTLRPERTLQGPTLSTTILVSTAEKQDPIFVTDRTGTNDQWDFLEFLVIAAEAGYLRRGDYLVLDNAAIHKGDEILRPLADFCENLDIKVLYMPVYSPELNPCELVFGLVKNHLRNKRDSRLSMKDDIALALASVTPTMMENWYLKCLNHFKDHPFSVPPGIQLPAEVDGV